MEDEPRPRGGDGATDRLRRVPGTEDPDGAGGGYEARHVAARAKVRRTGRIGRPLRLVLVAIAVIIVAFVLLWPQVQPRMDRLRIGMASLEKLDSDGEGLVNARLTGEDAKGRPYQITAAFVRQLEGTTGILGLDRPRGEIRMEDGTATVMTAADGMFYQDSRLLELRGDVVLVTGDGSRYETASADLDLDAGTATGTDPVRGRGPLGTISGEGFRATDFGETLFVTGRSTLVVDGSADPNPS